MKKAGEGLLFCLSGDGLVWGHRRHPLPLICGCRLIEMFKGEVIRCSFEKSFRKLKSTLRYVILK